VIGIANDVRQSGQTVDPPPVVYLPFEQGPPFGALLLARSAGNPVTLIAPIGALARELDPEVGVLDAVVLQDLIDEAVAPRSYSAALLAGFGALALVLTFVGVYATVSNIMRRRQRELAVRLSVGASPRGLLGLVIRDAIRYALPGLGLGLLAGAVLSRVVAAQLFGIRPLDPPTYLLVMALILVVVVLAATVPAVRAARLEPAAVLREE
jgi:ABC-type antimicrobial peptide transport system permease subunit